MSHQVVGLTIPLSIRGILFDSGDTLVHPIGGEWFPGQAFRSITEAHRLSDLQWDRLDDALQVGMDYLDAHHHLMTEDEELEQFQEYYLRVLQGLGLDTPAPSLIQQLAGTMVHDVGIEPFHDTIPALERLREQGLRLGVVSNSWPSLDRRYRVLGLRDYFDTFVISAQVGCLKPDSRIYQAALGELALPASQVLYVDDWPGYVEAAQSLGMRGVVLSRGGTPPQGMLTWIRDLTALGALVELGPAE